jgi:predicted esterase
MLKDIPKRLRVDARRFYAAGLSGGAKKAYAIAYKNSRKFRGIIACASAYDEWAFGGLGNISSRIVVYHTAGKDDFNLEYIREAHKKLQSLGVKSRLIEFDGGHEWPPSEIISDALDWIEKHTKR